MAKIKMSISIDKQLAAKIDAIKGLEKRGSFSNTLESVIDISKFGFIEVTNKATDKTIYIACYEI